MTKGVEGAKPETDWLGDLVLIEQNYQLEAGQWAQVRILPTLYHGFHRR